MSKINVTPHIKSQKNHNWMKRQLTLIKENI